tara:strand:+ start:2701 stop:3195 length:495 start_codon:yes stop_codon:yes gene_type:complete
MSRLSTHISFFGSRYAITVNDLQPGMVVEFMYRKTSVGKPETKRYTAMIVDPKYRRPQDKEDFTHAINLDVAPRVAILDIARRTGATMANSNLEARMVYADKLLVEGGSRQFYQNSISQLISGNGKGSYRTFKTIKILQIQLIDYTFPNSIKFYDPSELNDNEN